MSVQRVAIGLCAITALVSTMSVTAGTQSPAVLDEALLGAFTYRNLGPYRMGARTSDIAVPEAPAKDHLYTFYVGFWTGGVWKTTNNGTTFEPIFDRQQKLAVGDIAVAPSDANIVWVGTGDAFTSRSSYAGDGIYKSTDAGKTWTNMGLRDSHHIARIVIHPTNPEVVYVAAMGHLYSTNAERGVFKSTNGGKTWEKVLYVNDKIGVIDLALNPKNPDVLYAAAYDKQRLPWQMINGGPESGILKTVDAGKTWTRLRNGLPEGRIGRIGLDIFHGNPDILYAVVENQNPQSRRTRRCAAAGGTWRRTRDLRRRGLSHRQRRRALDEDERRRLQRQPEGAVLLQPDSRRSRQRPARARHPGRFPPIARRRTHLERAQHLSANVRRLPDALDRSTKPRSDDRRQRWRHRHLLRRRQDRRSLREHPRRRDLRDRRRHGGPVQHLRGPAGSRTLERPVERSARPRHGVGLACRRRQRRHVHAGRSEGQPLALHDASIRRAHARRSEARL